MLNPIAPMLTAAALALTLPEPAVAGTWAIAGPLRAFTMAEVTLLAFTLTNSVRVIAYVPQIWKAAKSDADAARGISCFTWILFLVSNITTVAYALVNLNDWTMAGVFTANAVGCTVIIACALWRRRTARAE